MAQPWGLVIILLMKKCQRPGYFVPGLSLISEKHLCFFSGTMVQWEQYYT